MIAVLLAGGSGTRFWPLSRELHPKQLQKLTGDHTLIQETFLRLQPLFPPDQIWVITHQDHALQTCQQLKPLGFDPARLIAEPEGRNTAAAIVLMAQVLMSKPDEVMAVFPADHLIQDKEGFHSVLRQAETEAQQEKLVTLGIKPTRPETGYGYIQRGEAPSDAGAFPVRAFKEKPDQPTAQSYLDQGGYYWNAGIFLWTARTILEEARRFLPDLVESIVSLPSHLVAEPGPFPHLKLDDEGCSRYAALKSVSVDYGIMEKSNRVSVVPCDVGWCDIGAWDALGALLDTDDQGNQVQGDVILLEAEGNIIRGDQRLIATFGIDNLIVVDTPDALLICPKNRAQDVKKLVELMREHKRNEIRSHNTVNRPWGSFTNLSSQDGYLIKRLDVHPGQKLSLQSHKHRSEHWVVVCGIAEIDLDGETITLKTNESTYIPIGSKHRLTNPGPGPLSLVEIQLGNILSEDDITRYEDIYGRAE